MPYRRSGRSGILLPAISLGLWHNFGHDRPLEVQRAILRRAFDLGHHPLRPGQQLRPALRVGRGELRPDPGLGLPALPRRAADLDQGRLGHVAGPVRRVRLAQVPARQPGPVAGAGWGWTTSTSSTPTGSIPTPRSRRRWGRWTPPSGRARRSTPASPPIRRSRPARPRRSCASLGTPMLIHQPSYSMLDRWIEDGLLDALEETGVRLHRLLAAGAGRAHRQVPRRHPGGVAGRAGRLALGRGDHRRRPGAGARR